MTRELADRSNSTALYLGEPKRGQHWERRRPHRVERDQWQEQALVGGVESETGGRIQKRGSHHQRTIKDPTP